MKQITQLYESLWRIYQMTGESFEGSSEKIRRKMAKGLLYESLSLKDFDMVRNSILTEAKWSIDDFKTEKDIKAELSRLESKKQDTNLPSIVYENIDGHIKQLVDKLDAMTKDGEPPVNIAEQADFGKHCRLLESVLDPINKTRCPEIFDSDEVMKPNIRKFVLDLIDDFKKNSKIQFNVKNVLMIGSCTGFQYTTTSDFDVELGLDIEDKNKWDLIPLVPKGVLIPGTQKPVNMFIMTKDQEYDPSKAENIYDILNNKWEKKTEKNNLEIPYQYIKDLATYFMNGCDLSISNYNRDVKEIDEYISLDPETQEISAKEKFEAIDRKLIDLKNDIDQLKMAHHVIFAFENEGYEGIPFRVSIQPIKTDDPRYSVNNLVYKMVDKHGYMDKMLKMIKEGRKKIKEVEEYIKTNKSKNIPLEEA